MLVCKHLVRNSKLVINANAYLDRKYNIYINEFAALKSGKNGES